MKIGVLGTGTVGATIGSRLIALGHDVKMGSRTSDNEKAVEWVAKNGGKASQGTFEAAAAFGELLFNCTMGAASIEVLNQAGPANLRGKVLIDVSNPLDFSQGMPPSLTVCNTNSLGEEIQKAFPELKVVKALNTMWCGLMVDPNMLQEGDHTVFMSGDDEGAKVKAREILHAFGWKDENILDLGGISTARGTEMLLPIWLRTWGALGTGVFNFKLVK